MRELVFLNKFTIELENFAVRDYRSVEEDATTIVEGFVRTNIPRMTVVVFRNEFTKDI